MAIKRQGAQSKPKAKPPGFGPFDDLIRGLVYVPKAEVDRAEADRQRAAKKKRAARRAKAKKKG